MVLSETDSYNVACDISNNVQHFFEQLGNKLDGLDPKVFLDMLTRTAAAAEQQVRATQAANRLKAVELWFLARRDWDVEGQQLMAERIEAALIPNPQPPAGAGASGGSYVILGSDGSKDIAIENPTPLLWEPNPFYRGYPVYWVGINEFRTQTDAGTILYHVIPRAQYEAEQAAVKEPSNAS